MTMLIDQSAIQLHRLANGITVTLERLPYLRSVSAGVWVKAGSGDEHAREAGVAHFLEHLFFKGTKTRSVHELMEAVEGKGGQINAFTSREYTCLYVKTLDSHIHTGIEILADLLKNSIFADLEKEKGVVLEEIASVEDTPDDYIFDLLSEFHWPDHPLGRSVSGTQESVGALTREDVVRFYETWYRPENLFISVAGNFDEETLLAQLREELECIPAGPLPEAFAAPHFRAGVRVEDREITQAHLTLAFPGPVQNSMERYTCDLVSSILGGGSTSWLFEKIREDEGLAYSIHTFQSYHPTAGMIGVYAAVAPQNYGKTLELTCGELARLRDEGVDEEELEMNREQIKGNMLMAMESTFTRMARMAKCMMYYGQLVSVDEVIGRIDRVTPAEIQAFAQRTFRHENMAIVTLGPTSGYDHARLLL